ncbi:hypothetical protein JCM15765_18850 [Paradesulfitobacterium aromaticivorans]
MAISIGPLADDIEEVDKINEIKFDFQFIKRSFDALTEDLLFLHERLNVRASLAAVFVEAIE